MIVGVLRGERLEEELTRLEAMTQYEREHEAYVHVCGADEVERGPLTSPVAVGVVIPPKDCRILYLNDSKKLSEKQREELFEEIRGKVVAWSAGIVPPTRIDEVNILQATYEAMKDAVGRPGATSDVLLSGAVTTPDPPAKQVPTIEGDAKSLSIAATSVLAKVTRDHMMAEYEEMLPGYGPAKHKGYGTAAHIQVIRELGLCPIYRGSFIRNFVKQESE